MPNLPSLASLSLNAHSTTGVKYDDQNVDPDTMPLTQEFNLLLLQNNSMLNVFGITERADRPLGVRGQRLKLMKKSFFKIMTRAILQGNIFLPSTSPTFFVASLGRGSTSVWDDTFSRASAALTKRAEGGFNVTYEMKLQQLAPQAMEMLDGLVPDGTSKVAFRRSKLAGSLVNMNRILQELVMQSRMSLLGIGPRLFVAWCTAVPEPVPTLASYTIQHVCSMSELFDGDLYDVFFVNNDADGAHLNRDVVDKLENRHHGLWKAVVKCIVLAAGHGILHFDLKGKNMLYRRVYPYPSNRKAYHYEVRYTDFDPYFFKVVNMEDPRIRSREACFGLLSLCQLLASSRCSLGDKTFVNSAGTVVDIDWNVVFEIATDELSKEYGERKLDITELCSFGHPLTWAGPPSLGGLREHLGARLTTWAQQYLATPGCIAIIKPTDYFQDIAEAIATFAEADETPKREARE